jgi:hypothetical protein
MTCANGTDILVHGGTLSSSCWLVSYMQLLEVHLLFSYEVGCESPWLGPLAPAC